MKKSLLGLLLIATLFACKKDTNSSNNTTVETPVAISATDIDYFHFIANFQSTNAYDSFKVYVAYDSNFTNPLAGAFPLPYSNSGVVVNLTPATNYYYKIKTYLNNNSSSFSNFMKVKTKDWDGQINYNGSSQNIITKNSFSGPVTYVDIYEGVTTSLVTATRSFISNVPSNMSGSNNLVDGSTSVINSTTIAMTFSNNNKTYYSKVGGTITKTGAKSFSLNCPVYLAGDATKTTVYTITGNCNY